VSIGNVDTGEFSPFRYLVNTLNLKAWRGVAVGFLTELTREEKIRQAVYAMIGRATKDEKTGLAIVLARSGDAGSVSYLQLLSMDPDPDVAAEGVRSLRALRARLP
jgi:hypothetical protein